MRAEIHAAAALAVAVAVAAVAAERDAHACGPYFPTELLVDRQATLLDLSAGVFVDEAARLVEPPADPFAVVVREPPGARARGGDRERQLYEEGAAAFRAGDHARAVASFEALLALPDHLRRHRSTWAAYMLGRIRDRAADYRRVRELVRAGHVDELGLAVASLGQEARVHLHRGELLRAVELYARQAALGDNTGATSLLFVVRQVIAERAEARLLAAPIGARLLATYLYTRSNELTTAERERLWSYLAESTPEAGKLAAAAYREGRFDLAARLAAADPDAELSMRVRAKLALRDGDTDTADRLLAKLGALGEQCREPRRVIGERATLALYQGRHLEAMGRAWSVRDTYPDAAYIAERVLTIDELVAFVEGLALRSAARRLARLEIQEDNSWLGEPRLSELLARRLLRAGQLERALPYFNEHRAEAAAYVAALRLARDGDDPLLRAAALFRASRVARESGLEIFGTSYGPDWGLYGANFDLSEWRRPGDDRWTTPLERQRLATSAAAPDRRYHYRYVASSLAEQAADLLPRRSQAFAATLCHAARYVFHIDRDRVGALWRRYVAEGPSVDFAATFGQSCPEPDIAAARRYLKTPPRFPWQAVLVGLLGALAGWFAFSIRRRLSSRRSHVPPAL